MGLLNDKIRRAGFSDNPWNMIDDSNLFSKLNGKTKSWQGSVLRRTSFGIAASFLAPHPINTCFYVYFKITLIYSRLYSHLHVVEPPSHFVVLK